jgi:hypothetical protein
MKKSRIKYNNGGTVKKTSYNGVASLEAGARGNNNNASANVTGSVQGKGLKGSASIYKDNKGYTATTIGAGMDKSGFSIEAQQRRDNYGKNTSVRIEKGSLSATANKNKDGTAYGVGYKKTTQKGTTFRAGVNINAHGLLSGSMSVSKPL